VKKFYRVFAVLPFLGAVALSTNININSLQAAPTEYIIDPEHFSIGFLVDHIGYAKILGMFLEAEGTFNFDEENLSLSNLSVEIYTMSVFTNHKKRDNHLRGPDFLNAREFPKMTFSGTSVEKTGDRTGKINGFLTLLGKSLSLSLDFTWNKSAVYPFGHRKHTLGVSARGSFQRSAYDMNYAVGNGWVGDNVELIVEFEAYRQE